MSRRKNRDSFRRAVGCGDQVHFRAFYALWVGIGRVLTVFSDVLRSQALKSDNGHGREEAGKTIS